MKVVFTGYLFDFERGSASTNLAVEYARGFSSHGFESILISHSSKKNQQYISSEYKDVECLQYKNCIGLFPKIERYFYSLFSVLKLWSYFFKNKKNTAFIFAFSTHASQLFWQILISKFFRVPIVYYLVEEQISLHGQSKPKSIQKKIKRWLTEFFDYRFQYLILFRLCDYVGCITKELQNYLITNWNYNLENILFLPNVKYLTNETVKQVYEFDNSKKVLEIYYGGEINFQKEDLPLLISEILKIRNDVSSYLRITITGYGKDAEKLMKFIDENHFNEWVHFKGFVDVGEQIKLLEKSDICLVLKTDIEFNKYNFPTKLLDYLYFGKLVFLTPLAPYSQFFTDRYNCIIINKVNSDNLTNQFNWILNNDDKVKFVKQNAFKTVIENYNAVNAADFIIQKLRLK